MNILYFFFLTISIAPFFAWSETTFEGTISFREQEMFFRDSKSWRVFSLKPANGIVRKDLSRLESGDVLQGDGKLDTKTNTIVLTSVHFVGLQKMIGIWSSRENTLFEFIDFNSLTIYHQNTNPPQGRYLPVKSYQYTVAPHGQEKWSILINDNTTINTGKLDVGEQYLTIQLIDSSTGQVIKTLQLDRLR